jgi:hypothetical protein
VTGEINEPARLMIAKAKIEKGGQIDFWEGDYLCTLIRNNWLDEFIDYFDIEETKISDVVSEETTVVDSSYIDDNYEKLVSNSRSIRRTMQKLEWEIVKTIIRMTIFEDGKNISMSGVELADILIELERTEDSISEELHHLLNLDYLSFDADGTVSLGGKVSALSKLAAAIFGEIVDAEEDVGGAEDIFCELVD